MSKAGLMTLIRCEAIYCLSLMGTSLPVSFLLLSPNPDQISLLSVSAASRYRSMCSAKDEVTYNPVRMPSEIFSVVLALCSWPAFFSAHATPLSRAS